MLGAGEALGESEHRAVGRYLPGDDLSVSGARSQRPGGVPGLARFVARGRPGDIFLPLLTIPGRGRFVEAAVRGASPSPSPNRLHLHQAVRQTHSRLDRVGEALAHVVAHDQAVDHDRDVVLVALVEHDRLLQHPDAIVDPHAREAIGAQLLQQLAVLALAPAHDGRHHHEAGALRQLHHLVDDLLCRLPRDRPPADRAVRLADA